MQEAHELNLHTYGPANAYFLIRSRILTKAVGERTMMVKITFHLAARNVYRMPDHSKGCKKTDTRPRA